MQYLEKDLVSIAKRENNTKRNYLVVDPLQGKHIPVAPSKALALFKELASKVQSEYKREKILFVGFAETATAIGAQVAICAEGLYIQTTRESIPNVEYLFFSETHSHATEQKLVKDDIDKCVDIIDRIIFVEDEVTTGNTILNIVKILNNEYPGKFKYSVASLLNGMNEECLKRYVEYDIPLHFIIKTNHDDYPMIADKYEKGGLYHTFELETSSNTVQVSQIGNYMNSRRLISSKEYFEACSSLWKAVSEKYSFESDKKYLVVGTEEFMFPALFVGSKIEEVGCYVRSHSTTRSPIMTCQDEDYPLYERYELRSLYDEERVTYIYNIDYYDQVLVITDADICETGMNSLVEALRTKNANIDVIRWC